MEKTKVLCFDCENCFIKTYKVKSKDSELYENSRIYECLIDKLHLRNDFINHDEFPIECNKYNQIKTK